MTGLNEIKTKLSAHKGELRRRYKVKEIGIFGSYAREDQKENSYIDILVTFEKTPGLLKFLELENHLSDLLGIDVDLVRKEAVRKELKDTILKNTVIL
ncbi:MAG: nucleotidyltransferase family protein [Candidatus Aminicenantes bacterium]|nr:MAG: nucleotidyltransferase family protein [Candidatus Aminicenantes bacterium]